MSLPTTIKESTETGFKKGMSLMSGFICGKVEGGVRVCRAEHVCWKKVFMEVFRGVLMY